MSKVISLSGLKTLLEPLVHLINKKAERPDWNENDPSSPDYIENRPFYEDINIVEYTVDVTNDFRSYDVSLPSFVSGETYNITWDGVEYNCVAYIAEYANVPIIGNDIVANAGETGGNGEPFGILVHEGDNLIFAKTTGIHMLGIKSSVIHKIDEKYLPESKDANIGMAGSGQGAEIFNDYDDNTASGEYSHSEGQSTVASGNQSHAEGFQSIAEGQASHTEGSRTNTTKSYSHAEGYGTNARGQASHAEGNSTIASGDDSHAEGNNTTASGKYSHAEGISSTAQGEGSHAEGNTSAYGRYSHSEGAHGDAYGNYSHVEGQFSRAYGDESHSEGYYTWSIGTDSHSEGFCRTPDLGYITGEANSLVYTIFVNGKYDFVNKIVFLDSDHTYAQILSQEYIGSESSKYKYKITVNKTLSTVKNYNKEDITILYGGALGIYSHVEGANTEALENGSHAEGAGTIAAGAYSHAEGDSTHSAGTYSHSEGNLSEAIGECSHAEGLQTIALGNNSSAHGNHTIATGSNNFTIGKYNKNEESGYIKTSHSKIIQYQYAYAGDTTASLTEPIFNGITKTYIFQNPFMIKNTSDIKIGTYLRAKYGRGYYKVLSIGESGGYFQIVLTVDVTEYLDPHDGDAFVIGNGTSDTSRSNAHTLDWNGNAWYAGDVYVGSTSGVNKDEGSKKLATEPYVSNQIAEHNTSTTAHSDIRNFIANLKNGISFIDQVNGYIYIACMREGNFVTYCAAKSIEVTSMPNKTKYMAGEYFDPTGMVVTATSYDGITREVTDFICPSSYITEGSTSIEIKYVEAGVVNSTTIPITVNAFDAATVLVDFDYTANDDGTYTITGWKGTLNGEVSTEIIIPDNGLIIV